MNFRYMKKIISLFLVFAIAACSYKPVFSPNQKYRAVGKEQADLDAKACSKEADEYLKEYKMRHALKESGRKAVVGTLVGAATGLISGGNLRSTLGGGLIGAGVGAVYGGGSVLAGDKLTPDQVKQRYVTNCLAGKGYDIIGWE